MTLNHPKLFKRLDQKGFDHVFFLMSFILVFAIVGAFFIIKDYADTIGYEYKLSYDSKTLCLDDFGDSKSTGSVIDVYTCKSGDNAQVWTINRISSNEFYLKITNGSNLCVEAGKGIGTGPNNKVYVTTATCSSSNTHQLWGWDGSTPGQLRNVSSGGCMNDAGNGKSDTALIVYACKGTSNERWYEVAVQGSTSGSTDGGSSTVSGEAASICKLYGYGNYECDAVGDAASQISSKYASWVSGGKTNELVCLGELWSKESGWRADVWNGGANTSTEPEGSSGAYGIPQSLPYSKLPKAGWPTGYGGSESASAQIEWGLSYIHNTYSTPCGAWSEEVSAGGY
jgi:hypothetical protein